MRKNKFNRIGVLLIMITLGIFSCGLPQKHRILGNRGNWDVTHTYQKHSSTSDCSKSKPSKGFNYAKISASNKLNNENRSLREFNLIPDTVLDSRNSINEWLIQSVPNLSVKSLDNNTLLGLKHTLIKDITKKSHSNKKSIGPLAKLNTKYKDLNVKRSNAFSRFRTLLLEKSTGYYDGDIRLSIVQFGLLLFFVGAILILGLTNFGVPSLTLFTDVSLLLAAALLITTLIFGEDDNGIYMINIVLSSIYLGIMGLVGLVLLIEGTLFMDSVFGYWGFLFGIFLFTILLVLMADPDAFSDLF